MGRKTYELAQKLGQESYEGKKNYVFSRTLPARREGEAGEVDAFVIHVIPVLIGAGIPLVQPRRRSVPLVLESTRSYPDGVVRLHYSVRR